MNVHIDIEYVSNSLEDVEKIWVFEYILEEDYIDTEEMYDWKKTE